MDLPTNANEPILPGQFEARLRGELIRDERVIWAAWQRRERLGQALLPLLIGLTWTLGGSFLALDCLEGARQLNRQQGRHPEPGPRDYVIWIIPAIGLVIMTIPLWVRLIAGRSCYVLTNRRAMILRLGAFGSLGVRSFPPNTLREMKREERVDGSGNLIFDEVPSSSWDQDGRYWFGVRDVGFLNISNVRAVEGLVRLTLLTPFHLDDQLARAVRRGREYKSGR